MKKRISSNLIKSITFFSILFFGVFGHAQYDVLPPQLKTFCNEQSFKKSSENLMVDFIVQTKSNDAKAFLIKNGAKIKYEIKDLISVQVPLSSIPVLAKSDLIHPLRFSFQHGVELNDTMRLRNRVNPVHQGLSPLDKSYDGEGVIIGFIDSGIDYTHPDFQNPDGSTRVLAIWDQTKGFDATYTPSKYGYGQAWDSAQINAGISTHDINGTHHGSTVAGCAAGNALASGDNMGVAPKADIIMVETNFLLPNWTTTVADAVEYIFSLADYYGKPCVINTSVGDYMGSHDASDPAGQMIEQLLLEKPGRLLVAAAGNSGTSGKYHLRNDVNSDTTFTWLTINLTSGFGIPAGYADVWVYKPEFDDVYFAIGADKNSPNFEFRGQTEFHNLILENMVDKMTKDSIVVDGNKLADIEYYVTEVNGSYELEIYIPEPDSSQYFYRFITTTQTSGRYDMWAGTFLGISEIISSGLPNPSDFPDISYYILPDTLQTIVSSWTCSDKVVTVGNYVSTDRYYDYNNNLQIKSNNFPGYLKQHSSKGPSRNDLVKPNVAATGDMTFSSGTIYEIEYYKLNDPTRLHKSGWHTSNGGTSMASPVVAGIGALLLQSCPNLTPDAFKEIITTTAFSDSYTGTLPNYAFGYGKVDAHAALALTMIDEPVISQSGNTLSSTSAFAYKWYKNGAEIIGETNQDYNPIENAQYMVEVFNQYGCSKFSQPFDMVLALDLHSKNAIIYPNPTSDFLYVQIDSILGGADLEISDVIGRKVISTTLKKDREKISVEHLDKGVYFIVLKNNSQEILKTSFVKN